ncbi:helix-turn-helix domain-containing protein [Flavobacterium flavigenum]|uniref:helix-turn-helix domain-containing protein n=1 Tax=Flavobacterium flavigenum TaxID=3003258 RepID=UPI0022AC57C1|nr:helix-turn-helix transcriptional regulator [Flavobacterium flavigenum]
MIENQISRQEEITTEFLKILDTHLNDIVEYRTDKMKEINEIAKLLNIHPTHLSDTIKNFTGKPACYFYENKIIDIAKKMLEETPKSIKEIAENLTYDPSNFTKFFKAYANKTPKQYRLDFLKNNFENKIL